MVKYFQNSQARQVKAKRHIKDCKDCKGFFEEERVFASMLKRAIKKDPVPGELINRIFNEKKQKSRYFNSLYQGLVVAALILLIAGGIYLFSINTDGTGIIDQIVSDHIQFLPSTNIQIISSDPDEIITWFKGKVDFPIHIPDIHAKLNGGRLCFFGKKRQVLLFYDHNISPISLFISDEVDLKKINRGKKVMLKNMKLLWVENRGYNLILWQDKGLTYTLVSELNIEDIKNLEIL